MIPCQKMIIESFWLWLRLSVGASRKLLVQRCADILALDVADGGVLDVDDEIGRAALYALGFIGGGDFFGEGFDQRL